MGGEGTGAPPPPAEVKVRTMRSDLASMAKSGGGIPRFENVKVSGLSIEKQKAPEHFERFGKVEAAPVEDKPKNSKSVTRLLMIFAAVAAVAAIGVLGYLGYARFVAPRLAVTTQAPNRPSNAGAAATTSTSPSIAASPNAAPPLKHISLFRTPADQVMSFTLSDTSPATGTAAIAAFDAKLTSLLAITNGNAALVEVAITDANGNAVPASELFSALDQAALDPSFVETNFNPDATFFVYRNATGSWPGYVLAPGGETGVSSLQSGTAKLETSPLLGNFFLMNPGAPAATGFASDAIQGSPVRVLSFPKSGTPTYFVYGWVKGDLIITTSKDAFAAAAARL